MTGAAGVLGAPPPPLEHPPNDNTGDNAISRPARKRNFMVDLRLKGNLHMPSEGSKHVRWNEQRFPVCPEQIRLTRQNGIGPKSNLLGWGRIKLRFTSTVARSYLYAPAGLPPNLTLSLVRQGNQLIFHGRRSWHNHCVIYQDVRKGELMAASVNSAYNSTLAAGLFAATALAALFSADAVNAGNACIQWVSKPAWAIEQSSERGSPRLPSGAGPFTGPHLMEVTMGPFRPPMTITCLAMGMVVIPFSVSTLPRLLIPADLSRNRPRCI